MTPAIINALNAVALTALILAFLANLTGRITPRQFNWTTVGTCTFIFGSPLAAGGFTNFQFILFAVGLGVVAGHLYMLYITRPLPVWYGGAHERIENP